MASPENTLHNRQKNPLTGNRNSEPAAEHKQHTLKPRLLLLHRFNSETENVQQRSSLSSTWKQELTENLQDLRLQDYLGKASKNRKFTFSGLGQPLFWTAGIDSFGGSGSPGPVVRVKSL